MSEKEIKKIMKNSNKIKDLLNIDYNRFQKELDIKNNKKLGFDDYFPTMNVFSYENKFSPENNR